MSDVPYKVLLPRWIWEQAQSKEQFRQLVVEYMQRYPHYQVIGIKDGFAICKRKGGLI